MHPFTLERTMFIRTPSLENSDPEPKPLEPGLLSGAGAAFEGLAPAPTLAPAPMKQNF